MAKKRDRAATGPTTADRKGRPKPAALPDGLPDASRRTNTIDELLARWSSVLEIHRDLLEDEEKLNAKAWDGTPESRASSAKLFEADAIEFVSALLMHLKNRSYEAIDAMLERRRDFWFGGAVDAIDALLRYVKPGIFELGSAYERIEYVRARAQFVRFDEIECYIRRDREDILRTIASDRVLFGTSKSKGLKTDGIVGARNQILAELTGVSLSTIARKVPSKAATDHRRLDGIMDALVASDPDARRRADASWKERARGPLLVTDGPHTGTIIGPVAKRRRR